jgi:hypothetical protein
LSGNGLNKTLNWAMKKHCIFRPFLMFFEGPASNPVRARFERFRAVSHANVTPALWSTASTWVAIWKPDA